MNIKRSRPIFLIFTGVVCIGFFASSVLASRDWVIDADKHWDVVRACTDGAEVILVDFLSTEYDPDGYGGDENTPPRTTVSAELWAQSFLADPQAYLDEDGNLLGEDGSRVNFLPSAYFYPLISSQQVIVGSNNVTPVRVDANNDGNLADYYLYAQDILKFNEPVDVGSWVLIRESVLVQVENCQLNELSSEGVSDLSFIGPESDFFPAEDIRYTVTEAPASGGMQIGLLTLSQDGFFSGAAFDTEQLRYFGAGGNTTARISVTGLTRISEDDSGGFLNDSSFSPTVSGNGSKVAYATSAIFPGPVDDQNGSTEVLYHDVRLGTTRIMSIDSSDNTKTANGGSWGPDMLADGTNVAFSSNASNFNKFNASCDNDTNGVTDVYVYNRLFNTVTQNSVFNLSTGCSEIAGSSFSPAIAGSETDISTVFQTAGSIGGQLTSQDLNNGDDVIGIRDGETEAFSKIVFFISPAPPFAPVYRTANGASENPDISADGSTTVFETRATEFFAGDNNGAKDIVKVDEQGSVTHISVNSNQVQAADAALEPAVSRFGNHIAFISNANNLTALDHNDTWQVYVRDTDTNCTVPISVSNDQMGNSSSSQPSISADGRFVAFQSYSSNLADLNDGVIGQIFVMDRDADRDGSFYTDTTHCVPGPSKITLVSANLDGDGGNSTSASPEISANGEFVVFDSFATNLIPSEENDRTEFQSEVYMRYLGHEIELTFSEPAPEPTETPTASPTETPNPSSTPVATAEPTSTPTPDPSATPGPPIGALDEMIYLPVIRR